MGKHGEQVTVLDRLKAHFKSDYRVAHELGVNDSYPPRWRRDGFIPETYALRVEDLHVIYRGSLITAYDVLYEARDARERRIAESERLMREAS